MQLVYVVTETHNAYYYKVTRHLQQMNISLKIKIVIYYLNTTSSCVKKCKIILAQSKRMQQNKTPF